MYLLYAVNGNSGRCLLSFMIFSANKQRFTQMDVNPFRTEQRMFSPASLWLWRISGILVARKTDSISSLHTHTSLQTYLSLWECVCPKGLLKSGRVSMDWVKALLLKGLLRRVSSLDLGDDGAITEFWKTGEWHFKANLPTHTQKWHSGDFVWTG